MDHNSITPEQFANLTAAVTDNRATGKTLQDKTGAFIQATTIAVNGGACIALLSAIDKVGFSYLPYVIFLAGIILSLLRSSIAHIIATRHIAITTAIEIAILNKKTIDVEQLQNVKKLANGYEALTLWSRRSEWLRFMPIITFVVGCVATGVSIDRDKVAAGGPANVARCAALQEDMLRARPRRLDSRELFQALGCRPQGEGSVYAVGERAIRKLTKAAQAPNI
ncbi:hypothetical protein SPHINGO391_390040 [Sphingomonas aurantiaca]|uniref:Uncharacterized protein n=1 Tax=Sphingomonas aurantiaca TaxID=185949 RepID=A0A5E7YKT3_9SPHN|nr:hypothetical protein [Sphingomonas aurantiaca]VVT07349.1 hypothetical protein SPHINGO391_390040 [Sphingomonas aurantiaca]